MSVSASIDIKVVKCNSDPVSPIEIIQMLLSYGWTFSHRGKMSYLPVGDNGLFDWHDDAVCLESLMEILEEKKRLGELIGLGMTWQDTNIGGEFLLRSASQLEGQLSMIISINRQILIEKNNLRITDVNWYMTRLLPALNQGDLRIDFFSYEEHE